MPFNGQETKVRNYDDTLYDRSKFAELSLLSYSFFSDGYFKKDSESDFI